MSENDTAQKIW